MVKPRFHGSVTASTLGEGNPSHLAERKDYVYKKRPGWPAPEARDDKGKIEPPKGGAVVRKAGRQERLKLFTAARAEGLDVEAAGKRVGVARKTAYRYERARLEALAAGAES